MSRTSYPVALAAALGLLALGGCAGSPQAPAAAQASGDTARYCALVAELEGIGERIFADVDRDAPPEELMRREGMLVEQGAGQFAELQRVAPGEIRDDVAVLVSELRARTTSPDGADPAAAEAAEERIRAFEEQACPGLPQES